MERRIFITLVICITLFFLLPALNAEECFPRYLCGNWTECLDGLQARECTDIHCNRHELIERRFCGDARNCRPQIECSDWSQCVYTEKTTDIFGGKIIFGGYRVRECVDAGNCVDSFTEEDLCEDTTTLEIKKMEECGIEYLVAHDPSTQRPLVKVALSDLKNQRLDITFTQGETKYCSACYNTAKDIEEQAIDCGGPCKPCREESFYLTPLFLSIALWLFVALAGSLTIYARIRARKTKARF